ncbi:MAG: hypothetical protein ACRCU1_09520, partial [Alsobacter sp.]
MSGWDRFDPSEPRRRKQPADALSHFVIVERDGADPDQEQPAQDQLGRPVRRCTICGAEGVGMILHHNPDAELDPKRSVCGGCQGRANARRLGLL